MSDPSNLKAAVDANVITQDQADKLGQMLNSDAPVSNREGVGEGESIRFLSNLNDIFLSIGIVILLAGVLIASGVMFIGSVGISSYGDTAPIVLLPTIILSWVMAEYFCGRRRMLLPSMILAITFSWTCALAVSSFFAVQAAQDAGSQIVGSVFNGSVNDDITDLDGFLFEGSILAFLTAAGAALGFYLRFRLPFSLFLVSAALAGAAYVGLFKLLSPDSATIGFMVLAVGVVTLLAAISFDSQDPERNSRLSDNAFWLHVAAAPQIIYGLRWMVEAQTGSEMATRITLIVVLVGLGLLSLALNRRALIVSGLATFSFAIWSLFQAFGSGIGMKLAGPLLFIGILIVLLGSGWRTARGILLKGLPGNGLWGRIFPPDTAKVG